MSARICGVAAAMAARDGSIPTVSSKPARWSSFEHDSGPGPDLERGAALWQGGDGVRQSGPHKYRPPGPLSSAAVIIGVRISVSEQSGRRSRRRVNGLTIPAPQQPVGHQFRRFTRGKTGPGNARGIQGGFEEQVCPLRTGTADRTGRVVPACR